MVKFGFILLWTRSSSEQYLPPLDCPTRWWSEPTFLVASAPYNGILGQAPCMSRAVLAHNWSALRLSQPLSGFCTDRVPRLYFAPQPFLDCLPSECSPREDRAPLSGPLASLQSSTVLRNAPPVTLLPAVSPTPTLLAQSPGSPTNYGFLFHESEGSLSSRPGSPTEGSLLPPASPASKLCSLHKSVRTDTGCPGPSGRYSPGFVSLSRSNRPNLGSSNPLESLQTQARILSRRIRSTTPGTESTPG
jgi:hypothetical protein